jgi:hypothetical protein
LLSLDEPAVFLELLKKIVAHRRPEVPVEEGQDEEGTKNGYDAFIQEFTEFLNPTNDGGSNKNKSFKSLVGGSSQEIIDILNLTFMDLLKDFNLLTIKNQVENT